MTANATAADLARLGEQKDVLLTTFQQLVRGKYGLLTRLIEPAARLLGRTDAAVLIRLASS